MACKVIRYFLVSLILLLGESALAERAPDVTFLLTSGNRIKLADALSKGPVLLHFWDTCCPGCREALPGIEHIREQYTGKLTVITLATDGPKSESKVLPLVKSKKYKFDVALDGQMEIFKSFSGSGSPLTLLIAPSGEIVLRREGASDDDLNAIRSAIELLLTVNPQSIPVGQPTEGNQ